MQQASLAKAAKCFIQQTSFVKYFTQQLIFVKAVKYNKLKLTNKYKNVALKDAMF